MKSFYEMGGNDENSPLFQAANASEKFKDFHELFDSTKEIEVRKKHLY